MGLLTYDLQISFARFMIDKTPEKEMIQKEVDFIMNVLPKGTEFLDVESQPNNGFSMFKTHKLTFGHPWFENGTKLEIDWQRAFWKDNELIKEANVFLGLRYIKPYPVNPMVLLNDVGAPLCWEPGCGVLIQAYTIKVGE